MNNRYDALFELGLTGPASEDAIRAAFRMRAKQAHPDLNGGTDALLRRLILARDLLLDGQPSPVVPEPSPMRPHRTFDEGGALLLGITLSQALNGGEAFLNIGTQKLRVILPKGLRSDDILRLRTEGCDQATQLFHIRIEAEETAEISARVWGDDIWMTAWIDAHIFAQGGQTTIETPHGPQTLTIGQAFERGSSLCLKGLGLPGSQMRGRGDLYVRLDARAPVVRSMEDIVSDFRAKWVS